MKPPGFFSEAGASAAGGVAGSAAAGSSPARAGALTVRLPGRKSDPQRPRIARECPKMRQENLATRDMVTGPIGRAKAPVIWLEPELGARWRGFAKTSRAVLGPW